MSRAHPSCIELTLRFPCACSQPSGPQLFPKEHPWEEQPFWLTHSASSIYISGHYFGRRRAKVVIGGEPARAPMPSRMEMSGAAPEMMAMAAMDDAGAGGAPPPMSKSSAKMGRSLSFNAAATADMAFREGGPGGGGRDSDGSAQFAPGE